jgi:hypothetical protein
MIGKIAVGLSFTVLLLPSIFLVVEAQRQGLEEEPPGEEPPGEAERAALTQKKMFDIITTCIDKMEIEGVNSTVGKECYALYESFNEYMKQFFNEHKEAIDHILYG